MTPHHTANNFDKNRATAVNGRCPVFFVYLLSTAPQSVKMPNTAMFTATMVEPTGVPARIETAMPKTAQTTEITAEQTVTERKVLKTRIDDSAGKITNAEISREPTKFIASTIITAIITAIKRL